MRRAASVTVREYAEKHGYQRTYAREILEDMVRSGAMQKEWVGPRVAYRRTTKICWHNPFNLKPGEANAQSLAFIQMVQIVRQRQAARAQAGHEVMA